MDVEGGKRRRIESGSRERHRRRRAASGGKLGWRERIDEVSAGVAPYPQVTCTVERHPPLSAGGCREADGGRRAARRGQLAGGVLGQGAEEVADPHVPRAVE